MKYRPNYRVKVEGHMHPEDAAIVGKQLATTARIGVMLFGVAALIFAVRWW